MPKADGQPGDVLYALIAAGRIVLCDTDSPSKSAKELTRQILLKLCDEEPTKDATKISFAHDSFMFHVVRVGSMVYMCIATEEFGRRRSFAFLEDVRGRFSSMHPEAQQCKKKHGYDQKFGPTLVKQMDFYSRSSEADAIGALRSNVDEAKGIIGNNVSHIIKIGESVSEIVVKANDLEDSAKVVRDQAKQIHSHYWWANAKYYIAIGLIVLFFAWYIGAKLCGGVTFPECRSEGGYEESERPHHRQADYYDDATPPPKPHTSTTGTGGKKHKRHDDDDLRRTAAELINSQPPDLTLRHG